MCVDFFSTANVLYTIFMLFVVLPSTSLAHIVPLMTVINKDVLIKIKNCHMLGNNTASMLSKYLPQKNFLGGKYDKKSSVHMLTINICVFLVLDSTESIWRHLWALGAPRATEVQELLVVFEEHLPRSLHSRSQPAQLWFSKITHAHQHLSPFQTSALRLATVGFHFGSPEAIVQFQSDTAESTQETDVVWTACTAGWFFSFCFLSLRLPPPLLLFCR